MTLTPRQREVIEKMKEGWSLQKDNKLYTVGAQVVGTRIVKDLLKLRVIEKHTTRRFRLYYILTKKGREI